MSKCSQDYEILKPNAEVDGDPISEWTEDWWTWILQSPAAENPGSDPTGDFAGNQPESPVFFIAGTGPSATGGSTTAERSFDVPEGPLLIPMLNFFVTLEDESAEIAQVEQWPETVTSVFASIDGEAVKNPEKYLVETDSFSAGVVQPDTVIDKFAEDLGADIEGLELHPTMAVGYWLMVDDLDPGMHTIVFGGSTSDGFSTQTTVHINVDPDYVWGV